MAIQSPRDFFFYDLCAMYDVEQKLAQMLPQMAQECQNAQASEAFLLHEKETREHVRNLEQCFQILGTEPRPVENYTIDGLKRDHDTFLQQQPPAEALLLFNLYAGYQSEYIEIAAYHSLIDAATILGLPQCAQLFQQNLLQEIEAAKKLWTLGHSIGAQQLHAGQQAASSTPLPDRPYGTNESLSNDQKYVAEATPVIEQPQQPNLSSTQEHSYKESDTANAGQPNVNAGPSTTANSPAMGRSYHVQPGMEVVGSDTSFVGNVLEIRDDDFRVDIPMHRDVYVPFTALQSVEQDEAAGRVILNIPADQVGKMNWPKHSIF
jgi:ferritin-like metal-binding protein YciE